MYQLLYSLQDSFATTFLQFATLPNFSINQTSDFYNMLLKTVKWLSVSSVLSTYPDIIAVQLKNLVYVGYSNFVIIFEVLFQKLSDFVVTRVWVHMETAIQSMHRLPRKTISVLLWKTELIFKAFRAQFNFMHKGVFRKYNCSPLKGVTYWGTTWGFAVSWLTDVILTWHECINWMISCR